MATGYVLKVEAGKSARFGMDLWKGEERFFRENKVELKKGWGSASPRPL